MTIHDAYVIKHDVHFAEAIEEDVAQALVDNLNAINAVVSVTLKPGGHSMSVEYDMTEESFRHICEVISLHGVILKEGWIENIRAHYFAFMDENAKDNFSAPEPPCCNKPGRKRRR